MGMTKLDEEIRAVVSEAVLTDELVRVPVVAKHLAAAFPEEGAGEAEIAERLMAAGVSAGVPMEIAGSKPALADAVPEHEWPGSRK